MDVTSANIKAARQHYHERETRRHARREAERQRWLQCVGGAIVIGYEWRRDHEMDVEVETEKR
jgi:hypothetical protein